MAARGEFSSRMAFILAASGSAIGLGNIWGFPIKVASNGGGAFVFTYIILTFLLAYPILMAELVLGRHAKADTVKSMLSISGPGSRWLGVLTGGWGMLTASLILSFYAIVAGWMISHAVGSAADLFGVSSAWLVADSTLRSLLFAIIFYALTISIIANGVTDGIEKWSRRLMPMLIVLIMALIAYIATLDGAQEGWRIYLQPDFSKVTDPNLVLDALSQAFFSLSLGVGTMMVYGSYISKSENLPRLGAWVAGIDIGIAVLAGMLVIPAMYVAQFNGVVIFDDSGKLIESGRLIFNVLPSLFEVMGFAGVITSLLFFVLMSIAALTSSISMLEVPVAYASDSLGASRKKSAWIVGGLIFIFSVVIIYNMNPLFDWVVNFATQFSEPLVGILFCFFVGWIWHRHSLLEELKQGNPELQQTLFWRIWPNYVRFACPAIVLILLIRSFGLVNF